MQQNNQYDYLFKLIQVGDESVGKTCLLKQYLSKQFDSTYETTIGVEFGAILVPVNDLNIKLVIWDTAGQQTFRSITRSYYRASAATLLVYKFQRRESFDSIPNWLEELKLNGNPNQIIILVGNMSDLIDERQVTYDEAQQFAQTNGLLFFEISAKNHKIVEELYKNVVQLILNNVIAGGINPNEQSSGVKFGPQKKQNNEEDNYANKNQEG